MSNVYLIEPERRTLHGHFSRDLRPILTINSGDTVSYRTLDAGWTDKPFLSLDQPRRKFEGRDPELDDGHALLGPIAIVGAEPGMTLEIHIDAVEPGATGYTVAAGWPHPVNRRLNLEQSGVLHSWTLDKSTMTGRNQLGHSVILRPFMGVMGMPPDEPGIHSTIPPRYCGGNIDCKELVAGSTLYLPIAVSGGLFSVGDGHAAQGDGESSVTAIECPMDRVLLTFYLRDDLHLTMPRAKTPTGWLTLGLHDDLREAMYIALEGMLDLLMELYNVSRADALALASVAVDLRITQIVNQRSGVHAFLPHGAIRR